MRRSTVMGSLPVDVLLHVRQRYAAVVRGRDRNVLHIFHDAHLRGEEAQQRELAGHEDERLRVVIAGQRGFERLPDEGGSGARVLFEEWFAAGARGGLELREPGLEARLVLGGIQRAERAIDEGRNAGIL